MHGINLRWCLAGLLEIACQGCSPMFLPTPIIIIEVGVRERDDEKKKVSFVTFSLNSKIKRKKERKLQSASSANQEPRISILILPF